MRLGPSILRDPSGPILAETAALHHATLPDSTISRFGPAYTRAFYRFAACSSKEVVFSVVGDDRSVIAGGVLSLEPNTLSRRLVLRTPLLLYVLIRPRLALELIWSVLSAPHDRKIEPPVSSVGELTAIFTRPDQRSRGIGRTLLGAVEGFLRSRGSDGYMVRTTDNPTNRALTFYHREGFQPIGRLNAYGVQFRLLLKRIDD